MIVLRSPKGWTGPAEVDGQDVEGSWRSHQVHFSAARENDSHRKILKDWLRSYRPEELFDNSGEPVEEVRILHPPGDRRMSANPYANGGTLMRDLRIPDFRDYAVPVEQPGTGQVEATRVLGQMLRDILATNLHNFRVFAPDENNSNRLTAVLEATNRAWALFREALVADLDDTQEGTTRAGIHLGAMAGTVDILTRSFAGLQTEANALTFDPRLPTHLEKVEFQIQYRGHLIDVALSIDSLLIRLHPSTAPPIYVGSAGAYVELAGGESTDLFEARRGLQNKSTPDLTR